MFRFWSSRSLECLRSFSARVAGRDQDVSGEDADSVQGMVDCVEAVNNKRIGHVKDPGFIAGCSGKEPVCSPVLVRNPLGELVSFLHWPFKTVVEHIVPITE